MAPRQFDRETTDNLKMTFPGNAIPRMKSSRDQLHLFLQGETVIDALFM
jgi:hypothetical protein